SRRNNGSNPTDPSTHTWDRTPDGAPSTHGTPDDHESSVPQNCTGRRAYTNDGPADTAARRSPAWTPRPTPRFSVRAPATVAESPPKRGSQTMPRDSLADTALGEAAATRSVASPVSSTRRTLRLMRPSRPERH